MLAYLSNTLPAVPLKNYVNNIITEDSLKGDAGERVFVVLFVVLLSAVVAHGDMKRKGKPRSRRGGSKT
jgi:hypothetical protein